MPDEQPWGEKLQIQLAYILLFVRLAGRERLDKGREISPVNSHLKRSPQLAWPRENLSFVIAVLVLLALATTLSVFASRLRYFPGDMGIISFVQSIQLPFFDTLMYFVTYLGFLVPVLVLAALIAGGFWWYGHRLAAIFIVLSLSDEIVSTLVKLLVQRPRPTANVFEGWLGRPSSSFPSGHAVHFIVFYGLLIYLAHTTIEQRWLRWAIYVVGGALIILVGFSRVYLGAHWPSDVLGGYVIGALWLLILIRAYEAVRRRISA
ncbi:MAG: phosphatase PAP2 family protein [Chloroflexi bacterium]|nr:phosphatase PAP2 family protein [Chloroflexota bacterium]